MLAIQQIQSFSGPLPHPDDLAAYDRIFPGAAKTIFDQVDAESQHRRNAELTDLNAQITIAKRGQILGFVVIFAAILGGFLMVALDKQITGVVALVAAVGTAGWLLYGQVMVDKD